MLFRKTKKTGPPPAEAPTPEPEVPPTDPQVLETLERLKKAGVQLLVHAGGPDAYTTEVVGLGRDGFFVDTLSPPDGDRRMVPGRPVRVETLLQGISYAFETEVLAKVQFVDELPAFKLAYPDEIPGERRRKSPRIDTAGDASLSFLHPFRLDAPVVNVSEGGLAFEYEAAIGRLRPGTVVREILLELGRLPVITVQGRVVGNVVAELGGISLPRRYRASLAFEGMDEAGLSVIRSYIAERKVLDATA